ncbi:hypothetical protein LCGC14_2220640, partial [marine sediment metagenome]
SMHRRILASDATLCAVGDVLVRFMRNVFPEHADIVRRWVVQSVGLLVAEAKIQAAEVEALSPLMQLTEFIREEFAQQRALFGHAKGISEKNRNYPNNPTTRADRIGWHEAGTAYISKGTTFGWYEEKMRRRGDVVAFSWRAVVQEIRNGGYGTPPIPRDVVLDAEGSTARLRLATLPLKMFRSPKTDKKKRRTQ